MGTLAYLRWYQSAMSKSSEKLLTHHASAHQMAAQLGVIQVQLGSHAQVE